MKEKQIQTIFGKENKVRGFFELKLSKSNRLSFNSVKPHQIEALLKASQECIYHKISDSPWTQKFTAKKPFDCFNIQAPAYVVVCWYIPRKPKLFTYITIEHWLNFKSQSGKKSLTKEEAEQISSYLLTV